MPQAAHFYCHFCFDCNRVIDLVCILWYHFLLTCLVFLNRSVGEANSGSSGNISHASSDSVGCFPALMPPTVATTFLCFMAR